MKKLDKTKAYDLSNLNNDELYQVAEYVYKNKHRDQAIFSIEETIDWFTRNKGIFFNYNPHYTMECWGFFNSSQELTDAKELFEEWTPKQGEKVLVSGDGVEWVERFFVTKYNDYYYTSLNDKSSYLFGWKYIKPFEEEQIKVGDWVKRNNEILKLTVIPTRGGWTKITNPDLISLLESEL